jgi:adenosine deaminase
MPSFYQTSVTAEYLAAVEACGLNIDELEQVALNAVKFCQLSESEKNTLIEEFTAEYAALRIEHLPQPATSE